MSSILDKNSLQQVQKASVRALLQGLPQYQTKSSIHQYEKQLVETRTMIYHKQTRRLLSKEELKDPQARKAFVIARVARELLYPGSGNPYAPTLADRTLQNIRRKTAFSLSARQH